MPSDPKPTVDALRVALESELAPSRQEFHNALVSSFEELRGLLRSKKGDVDPQVDGAFTAHYMDTDRFHQLQHHGREDACDWPRLEQAMEVLGGLAALGDDLYRVRVQPGQGLRCAVNKALARVGRAFAAARTASLAQAGLPGLEGEAGNLQAWPFARWSRTERALAPALLVELPGEDLAAETVAEFLDGGLHLVFLVTGPASPAPLAGLVRPGFHVAQLAELPDALDLPEGRPAVVGLFPEAGDATATFTHRPAAPGASGAGIWERLEVTALPEAPPRRGLGPRSADQQAEELRLLASLAVAPEAAPTTAADPEPEVAREAREGAAASADPVDRLAAWLLSKRRR